MSFDLTAYAAEAKAWLAANAPEFEDPGEPTVSPFAVMTPEQEVEHVDRARRWQRRKYDGGWAGIALDAAVGGRGLPRVAETTFLEEEARYHLPTHVFDVTLGMVMPTLARWSPERRADIEAILRGEAIWCQLMSEPGAGSDLASLSSRAVPTESGGWRITGQKVWTTYAHESQRGYVLARTGDVPGHAGISAFAIDMSAPGVTVRRLPQVTGSSTFNEVFLDDVEVPAEAMIGGLGQGWQVAMTTLMNERLAVGGEQVPYPALHAEAARRGLLSDPAITTVLGEVLVRRRLLEQLRLHVYESLKAGSDPGPESSAGKLFLSESVVVAGRAALAVIGRDAARYDTWSEFTLASPGVKIAGGTDEIQKNIIADRILGLPREPRAGGQG